MFSAIKGKDGFLINYGGLFNVTLMVIIAYLSYLYIKNLVAYRVCTNYSTRLNDYPNESEMTGGDGLG